MMKKGIITGLVVSLICALINFNYTGTAFAEAPTTFSMASLQKDVKKGDIITVTIEGANVKNLFAYELLLTFDRDRLEFSKDDPPRSKIQGKASYKSREDGTIQIGCTKQDAAPAAGANLPVCSVDFRAKATGSAFIRLDWVKVFDIKLISTIYTPGKNLSFSISSGNGSSVKIEVPAVLNPAGEAEVTLDDEEIAKAFADSQNVNINVPPVSGAKSYVIYLPSGLLASGDAGKTLTVVTETGSICLPLNALNGAGIKAGAELKLSISAADLSSLDKKTRDDLGGRPAINLKLTVDGKTVSWDNPEAPVTVSIPYSPTAEELANSGHITAWYIDGNGKAMPVPTGRYDPATGTVMFKTTHFSIFAVSYVFKTFKDIDKYPWAKQAIEVMASKGVINGVSADRYAPASNITRADFIVLLVRSLGLSARVGDNFPDIKKSAYYYDAVGIAKKLGVIQGRGNNKFDPEAFITRQELITTAHRAMVISKKELGPAGESDLSIFADRSKIASYALDSVAVLVKNGIIQGDGSGVAPLKNTSRAEVAVIIYRIFNK